MATRAWRSGVAILRAEERRLLVGVRARAGASGDSEPGLRRLGAWATGRRGGVGIWRAAELQCDVCVVSSWAGRRRVKPAGSTGRVPSQCLDSPGRAIWVGQARARPRVCAYRLTDGTALRSESGPGRGGRALQAGQRLNGLRLPGYESIRVRFGLGVVERARLPPR